MKVLLLGWRGEFSSYEKTKKQFYRYTYQLYTRLKANKLGIDVDGIETTKFANLGKGASLFTESLLKDFGQYDIVHSPDFGPVFPLRKGKSKLITTVHDFQFVFEPEINKFATKPFQFKELMFEKVVLPLSLKSVLSSDFLISVSTLTKDDVVKLGFERKKVFVVNHGVDERFFAPIKRKKDKKKFIIGTMSGGGPRKNLPFAIRAFEKIPDPNIHLEIWGNLTYNCEDFDRARKNPRIDFKGFAPDDKIVDIYDSFDVFVFPSLYEGFGIPIIEAMARGLPIILNANGKIPNETRKYCLLAKDEERMAEMIQHIKDNGFSEKERKRIMTYGRSFTWDKTIENTIKAYQKAMDMA